MRWQFFVLSILSFTCSPLLCAIFLFFVKIGHRYLENSACAVLQGTLALGNLKNLQGENMKERG